jgi:hypothetical protein
LYSPVETSQKVIKDVSLYINIALLDISQINNCSLQKLNDSIKKFHVDMYKINGIPIRNVMNHEYCIGFDSNNSNNSNDSKEILHSLYFGVEFHSQNEFNEEDIHINDTYTSIYKYILENSNKINSKQQLNTYTSLINDNELYPKKHYFSLVKEYLKGMTEIHVDDEFIVNIIVKIYEIHSIIIKNSCFDVYSNEYKEFDSSYSNYHMSELSFFNMFAYYIRINSSLSMINQSIQRNNPTPTEKITEKNENHTEILVNPINQPVISIKENVFSIEIKPKDDKKTHLDYKNEKNLKEKFSFYKESILNKNDFTNKSSEEIWNEFKEENDVSKVIYKVYLYIEFI